MKERTIRKTKPRSAPYWMGNAAERASRTPRYGRLDCLPPSAEFMKTLAPVRPGPKKDLTREGVEPNPGPRRDGSGSSSSSLGGSASTGQKRKQWRPKAKNQQLVKDLIDQMTDLDAQLKAKDDPRRQRAFDKREERDDKRWKWEKKRMRHTLWREKQERKDAPLQAAHEQAVREHQRWKEAQEMEAEKREAAEKASLEEKKLKENEDRLTAIFDTLKGLPITYFWVEKDANRGLAWLLLLGCLCGAFVSWLLTFIHMMVRHDVLIVAIMSALAGAIYCAGRFIYWILWEMGGVRNVFHFLPDEGAMTEWDLRPDAQAVGENKHTNPLYTQGLITIRKGGLLGWKKQSEHKISVELLSQLLNPNSLDIDASFIEKRGRIARLARTCHSINLNRFNNVIQHNVVEDTAYFALAAIMDRERRIEHVPFRIPLSQAVPASAPTWRV